MAVALPGTVESVCTAPDSYVVRLVDGRAFRRTRRDININNASSVMDTARPVATVPVLPKLLWQPPSTHPICPELPSVIPTTPPATGAQQPSTTTVPRRRGRPPKTTSSTQSQQQVLPSQLPVIIPDSVVDQPGSTRSGRPYLKS